MHDDMPHVFGAFKLQHHDNGTELGLQSHIARRITDEGNAQYHQFSAGVGSDVYDTVAGAELKVLANPKAR